MRFLPGLFLFVLACQSPDPSVSRAETAEALQVPEDFVEFYELFHSDSAYQMAHIQWPLQGVPSNDSLRVPGFAFQAEDWSLHQIFDPAESGYRSEFEMMTEDLIIERINDRQGRYGLVRRWLRDAVSEEWMLIYYQQPMPLAG